MNLTIEVDGRVRGVYGEEIDLDALGPPRITRTSHVEPDVQGRWLADMAPVGGPILGPFERRSEALNAEMSWLEENWLVVMPGERDQSRTPGHTGKDARSGRRSLDHRLTARSERISLPSPRMVRQSSGDFGFGDIHRSVQIFSLVKLGSQSLLDISVSGA